MTLAAEHNVKLMVCDVALRHTVCVLDISFVVDHSDSIRDTNVGSEDNWQHVIEFMVTVAESINLGADGTHVGSVSFGM